MMKVFTLLSVLILSVGCIKTVEQVNREKRFDSISEQMGDTQGLLANIVAQMRDMQSQLDRMNGRLEELEHKQSQVDPEGLKQMSENMNLIKTQQETQSAQLLQIQNELKEQRGFIEKVTQTLAEVKKAPAPAPVAKKKSAKDELEEGLQLIKNDKYGEARAELEPLIDHPDLTAGNRNKVLHGLGKVEYYTGNHEKALVYFSKIITKYPRSSLAPSSLLFVGRAFKKMGKKEEAKQAFNKVVEDYKDSREANEARKEL
jgi:TolA-binding protein